MDLKICSTGRSFLKNRPAACCFGKVSIKSTFFCIQRYTHPVSAPPALQHNPQETLPDCEPESEPLTDGDERAAGSFLYASVCDLLEEKISSSDLPPGTVLKTGSIANQLAVSRAPVRRALSMLCEKGLIRAAEGQGYIVGNAQPIVLSSRDLHQILAARPDDMDRSARWERIFADVHHEVIACMPFGHYRILEADLGDYFRVSRTVAREVLWRLTDRRLIEKDRKSHWIVGQLSARDIRDTFEMRQVLEPKALLRVAPTLDRRFLLDLESTISAAIAGFPACGAKTINDIETAMFQTMYQGLRNRRMLGSIRRNQTSLIVPRLFREHFPVRDDLAALQAYAQVVHHLIAGTAELAAKLMENHLIRVEPITLARLRVLSVLPPPRTAPYLVAIH